MHRKGGNVEQSQKLETGQKQCIKLFEQLIGKCVEVKTIEHFFFHGKLVNEDDNHIFIEDIVNGYMALLKTSLERVNEIKHPYSFRYKVRKFDKDFKTRI